MILRESCENIQVSVGEESDGRRTSYLQTCRQDAGFPQGLGEIDTSVLLSTWWAISGIEKCTNWF